MSRLHGRDVMLFDGDCGICTKTAEIIKSLDTKNAFVVEPYFAFSEDELAPFDLDYAQSAEYLRVIAMDGQVYSGAAAVNYIGLRLFPLSLLFALLYIFPFGLFIEAIAYDLIARYRTEISSTLGLTKCAVRQLES